MFHLTELWSLCGLFSCGWCLSFSVEPTERINCTEQPIVTEHTLSCVQAWGVPSEAAYSLFSNHPSVLKCHLHQPRHPQTHTENTGKVKLAVCQRPFRSLSWKRVKSKEPPTGHLYQTPSKYWVCGWERMWEISVVTDRKLVCVTKAFHYSWQELSHLCAQIGAKLILHT